jgi:hypothetical protein
MTSEPVPPTPGFEIPLSATSLAHLGLMAVLWGQIDHIIDNLIAHAYRIDYAQRRALVGEKPIGAKVDLLKSHIDGLPAEAQENTRRFLELITATKQDRNAAFHGLWAIHLNKRTGVESVAALYGKSPNNPLTPDRFLPIIQQLAECSNIGCSAMFVAIGQSRTGNVPVRFTFADLGGEEPPPHAGLRGPWSSRRRPPARP